MRKLAILVPWDSPFMYSEFAMSALNIEHPEGWQVRFIRGDGWCPAARHNNCVVRGWNWGAHAMMFLGPDHVVDPDIAVKLLDHLENGWDMATGWIPSRAALFGKAFPFVAFRDNQMVTMKDSGPIDMIGTGSLMLKVDVINNLRPPWFTEFLKGDPLYGRHVVQDTMFVKRATGAGFSLYLDTSIQQKHLQIFPIDESYSERFQDKAEGGEFWHPITEINTKPDELTPQRAKGFEGDGSENP